MSETTAPTPVENVGRGTLVALLSIVVGVGFALVGAWMFGSFAAIAAIVVGQAAIAFYARGAGTALSKAGWMPVIIISAVGVLLAAIAGAIGGIYFDFSKVGGDGGPFGEQFLTILGGKIERAPMDVLLPVLLGLGAGVVGIVSALRGPQTPPAQKGPRIAKAPTASAEPTPENPTPENPEITKPSPGIMLNGKPLEPDER